MSAPNLTSIPFLPTLRESARKQPVSHQSPGWKILTFLCCLATAAAAEQSGDFIYTDNGATVTITGYAVSAPNDVVVPATIVTSLDPLVEKPVTAIGASAFEGRTELTSMTISSGVTSIGNRAFFNCGGLTSASIPSGIMSIGRNAFSYCVALEGISLPTGLTSIGIEVFLHCDLLASVTIPAGVTSIGTGAFSYCSKLKSLVIPSGVISIGSGAFSNCSGLTSVTLPSTITTMGSFAFQYCSGLTSVTIPTVTSLQNKVFANCRGLETVDIPASVTTVHVAAFAECSSLTSFTVAAANPNYSTLNGLLTNKTQTSLITCPAGLGGNFTIPAGFTTIGNQAFRYCSELASVTIPSSVTNIESQAFSTCEKLVLAVFEGNAPTMVPNAFELAAPGFTINFLNSSTGFTTPTWYDYPAIGTGEGANPVIAWLLSHNLPANADLQSDDNGDGINLLLAYALDLDPNVSNPLPQPVLSTNQMSLSFYSGTPGITYIVKASDDMLDWSAEGVVLSEPDANQIRTATVPISGNQRFLRLEVNN